MNIKKLIFAIPILMLSSTAFSGTYIVGGLTPTGMEAFADLQSEPLEATSYQTFSTSDILYLNMDSVDLNLDVVNMALDSGAIVVADATEVNNPDNVSDRISEVFGVGVESPLTVIYSTLRGRQYIVAKPKLTLSGTQKIQLNHSKLTEIGEKSDEYTETVISEDDEPVEIDDDAYTKLVKGEDSNATIESVNAELLVKSIAQARKSKNRIEASSNDRPYMPEFTYDVRILRPPHACNLISDWSSNTFNFNFCDDDKGYTIDLNYSVALIRSIRALKSDNSGHTKDAKYARISISPSTGEGAGVHLRDSTRQEHSWFQSWANNTTRFGPYAKSYRLFVTNTGGVAPLIASHAPVNENKEYNHETREGFEVGVNLGANANIGDKGPSGGVEIGASISSSHVRVLRWNTKEYSILDSSHLSNLDVSWKR